MAKSLLLTTTKEEVAKELIRVYNENNFINAKLFKEKTKFSDRAIEVFFGSYTQAYKELNIPNIHRGRNRRSFKNVTVTKDMVLNDIIKFSNDYKTTNRDMYLKHGLYPKSIYSKFGTWNSLLEECSLKINVHKKTTKDDVIKEMLNLYNKYGYLTAKLQREKSQYSNRIINKHFGSFSNMLVELNIRKPYGKYFSNKDVEKDVLDIYKNFGVISTKLLDNYCIVSSTTIINRYGSIKNLCNKLEIENFNDNRISKYANFVLELISKELNSRIIYECEFDWLINPKTNKKLRVDGFCSKYNLAIEIDGKQHKEMIPYIQKNKNNFLKALDRDLIKESLIKKNNFKLLRISYNTKPSKIISMLYEIIDS